MYSILPNITHNFAEDNTCDIIASGGIKELLRITRESPREDTRSLAKKALDSNPAFLREIQWVYGQDKPFVVDSFMIHKWYIPFSEGPTLSRSCSCKQQEEKSYVWMRVVLCTFISFFRTDSISRPVSPFILVFLSTVRPWLSIYCSYYFVPK